MKHRIVIVLVATIFNWACSGNEESKLLETGVSLELAQNRQARITELEYDVNLNIPIAFEDPIAGFEIIRFNLSDASTDLILDFKVEEEYLKAVHVNNEPALDAAVVNEHIVIPWNLLQEGANEIAIEFLAGESSLNRNEDFLYTLFVPDRARTAIPIFDQPNLKGKYKLKLEIPETWTAMANGSMVSEEVVGSQRAVQFEQTKPISTYLFSFVVGKFQSITKTLDGREMTMLHRETDLEKVDRNVDEIFRLHKSSIDWMEDYTGILYPFQKFDFALIPSFQYGGMEHVGAIQYKASSLMLDEDPTKNQELGRASLIAHETAHMWFGDLVTMDWFNDVWMKEVFANFMAAKIVHPSFPEINHDLRFLLSHYPGAYSVDRTAGANPIQQELDNLKNAGSLYGAIIYQKAPIVMRMLESRIGKENMQQGLQRYLEDYSYGNATWDDLISILDSYTGENLSSWSRIWVKEPGMPSVGLNLSLEDDSTIKSLGFNQLDMQQERQLVWVQNIEVYIENQDTSLTFPVSLDQRLTTPEAAIGLSEPGVVVPNSAGMGYGLFRLGPKTRAKLLDSMEIYDDPVFRGVGWINLWENMLYQKLSPEILLEGMIEALTYETDPLIVQRLLGYTSSLYWKFLKIEQRDPLTLSLENTLWNLMVETDDTGLRKSYFNTYRSIANSDLGVSNLLDAWKTKGGFAELKLSESDLTSLAFGLAIREHKAADSILLAQLEAITNTDRKARMEFLIPAVSSKENERDAFFESLKTLENRHHESWVQTGVGYLHHPLRAESAIKYIRPTLDMLQELQATGDIFFPKRVLDNTFGGHQTMTAVEEVRQFFYKNNHYPLPLKNKILQSSDLLFRASEIIEPPEVERVVK